MEFIPGQEILVPDAWHEDVKAIMGILGYAVNDKPKPKVYQSASKYSYYNAETHEVFLGEDKQCIVYHELTHAYQCHDLTSIPYYAEVGAARLKEWLSEPAEIEARSVAMYVQLFDLTPPVLFRKLLAKGKVVKWVKATLMAETAFFAIAITSGMQKSHDPLVHNYLRRNIRSKNFI